MEGHGESQGETAYGVPVPFTVQQIYDDFVGRHASFITALTVEFDAFEVCCRDADHVIQKRLWAYPGGRWEVCGTDLGEVFEMPPPTPCLDRVENTNISKEVRATEVASHCDTWLISVVNYFSRKIPLVEADRQRLLNMIGRHQTVSEAVSAFKFSS